MAQTKRKSSANQAQINAQIIFPMTSVIFEMRRKPFCQLRKPFCLEAQIILRTEWARLEPAEALPVQCSHGQEEGAGGGLG